MLRRLLRQSGGAAALPFVLSIGAGPRGSMKPSTFKSVLPVCAQNYCDMTDFEQDFVLRCVEYLTIDSPATLCPEAVTAALSSSAVPRTEKETGGTAEHVWCPLLDVVMLPEGVVYFGWFRSHPLDNQWIDAGTTYLADAWQRVPQTVRGLQRDQLRKASAVRMPFRLRRPALFRAAAELTPGHMDEFLHQSVRQLHVTARSRHPLEDAVLTLCGSWNGAAQVSVQSLVEGVAASDTPLSTGVAVALLRVLLCNYAVLDPNREAALRTQLAAAAQSVALRAKDCRSCKLLSWAAALTCTECEHHLPDSGRDDVGNGPPPLLATLRAILNPCASARAAALRDQLLHDVMPLHGVLLREEMQLLEMMTDSSRSTNPHDTAAEKAAAAAALSPATRGFLEAIDDSYLTSVLRGEERAADTTRAERHSAPSCLSPPPTADAAVVSWLPSTGMDVRGCWCDAATHAALLRSQLRLHSHAERGAGSTNLSTLANDADRLLRVSLLRRSGYVPTASSAATQYSFLAHLCTLSVELNSSVTLLHLGSALGGADAGATPPAHCAGLMALLYLFPSLEVRSFFGGTCCDFVAALEAGTRAFRCYTTAPLRSSPNPPDYADTVHVPEAVVKDVCERLSGRDSAVLCVVMRSLVVADVFVSEDLPVHLRSILAM